MIPTPLPVTTGFTWTAAGAWATFFALVSLIIRQIGPWRKQTTEATDKLIDQLGKRVDALEAQLKEKDRLHFIELRRIEARHDAQRSLDRHKFNNSEMVLDSLLNILEFSPDRAQEAARRAREQRQEQRRGEHMEAAAIHAAEMQAVADAERTFATQDQPAAE